MDRNGEPLAACADLSPRSSFGFEMASLIIASLAMVCTLGFGMLPMLFGILGARAASLALAGGRWMTARGDGAKLAASLVVGALALGLCAGMAAWGLDSASKAVREGPAMAMRLVEQVHALKEKLPESIGDHIPDDDKELQSAVANAIASQASTIAGASKSWAGGAMLAVIGWIIGLLMANASQERARKGPLARALRERGRRMAETFEKIVVAQFFVACANTLFAAVFMLILLPLAGERMPWVPALLALTMGLSMIPVAGNVICNAVTALVALSVGPGVAVSALVYLVTVHKIEYLISAKVLGNRVSISIWELLLAMFVLEAVFGLGGLVAAPLFYAYAKGELIALGWV